MSSRRYTLAAITAVVLLAASPVRAEFFYLGLNGDTIRVTPSDSIIVVSFNPGALASGASPSKLAASVAGLSTDYPFWEWIEGFWVMGVTPGTPVDSVFVSIKARSEVGTVNPVVQARPDMLRWMTLGFIARFDTSVSSTQIDSLNAAHGVTIGYGIPGILNEYVLRMPTDLGLDVLSICREYYESGLCVFVQPNFVFQGGQYSYPNDAKYSHQWHFHNDGSAGLADADIDADSAWMLNTGSPAIRIAGCPE